MGYSRDRIRRLLYRTEIFVYPSIELSLLKISYDDQHSIVGTIKFLVKLFRIRTCRRLQLVEVTDHTTAIRMLLESDIVEVPIEPAVRLIENTCPILLLNYLAFGKKIRFI